MSLQSFLRALKKKFFGNKVLAGCGHIFQQSDNVSALGRTITTKVPLDEKGSTSYCHHCLAEMVVPCAWCLEPIFIGNMVTLYGMREEKLKKEWELSDEEWEKCKEKMELPWGSKIYSIRDDFVSLVGCSFTDCADSGADYCGIWVPPGRVERYSSLIEKSLINESGVTSNDLSDPNAAVPIR